MSRKTKLELTWVGKENRPRLEPRVLIDVPELSHAGGPGSMDNLLVQGDNLLALKALEADYAGRVKCVYIDPPYNTGSAFEHYDDGLEHSIWLSMMRDRVEHIRALMADDGLFFAQIDDNEFPYFAVMLDEVFGRTNRVNVISVKMSEASGVKMSHVDKKLPKLKEYVLVYRKLDTPPLTVENVAIGAWNDEYKTILLGISQADIEKLKLLINSDAVTASDVAVCNSLLKDAFTESLSNYFKSEQVKPADQDKFKYDNAWRIIQAVGSSSVLTLAKSLPRRAQEISAGLSARGLVYLYKTKFDEAAKQPRIQVIFADENLMRNPGDFWTDIKTTGGVGQEGGVLFPNGKKPEALLKRIIGMCTNPGDLVLDSFAGSGTTGAVAHKMGRRWIMVEIGDHAQTHIVPRLRKVIDGTDAGGVTAATNWQGGGGFRFCRLAPSLITRDKWGREVISAAYDGPLLAQALCKIKGFRYDPSETDWWVQGKSSDTDFLHVTTQTLSHDQLAELSELVGDDRSLLILCAAWRGDEKAFPNLTVSKIPDDVLKQCDFGREDYGLPVTGDAQ